VTLPAIFEDQWFVGIVSGVVVGPILFLLGKAISRIRELSGPFSGTYIALSTWSDASVVLVEEVSCRHYGTKLSGSIRGVTVLRVDHSSGKIDESERNDGCYRFVGSVDERLLVLSYRSSHRGYRSAGTVALQGNDAATVFAGAWAGLASGRITHSECTWVKQTRSLSSRRNRTEFIALAIEAVKALPMPAEVRLIQPQIIIGRNARGKSAFVGNVLFDRVKLPSSENRS
jgi:hypothetical protein